MNKKNIISFWITLLLLISLTGCGSTSHYFVKVRTVTPTMEATDSTEIVSTGMPEPTIEQHGGETMATEPVTEAPAGTNQANPTETPSQNLTEQPTHSGACGQSGTMTFLVIGSGSPKITTPDSAALIRVVRADFDAQTLKIIAFPTDLLVKTASLNAASQLEKSLAASYIDGFTANNGATSEKVGMSADVLSQLLFSNFELQTDQYMVVQIDQFGAMVDTIDGVEIDILNSVNTNHGINIEKGLQTLHGPLAIEYLSYLDNGGEADRIARQDAFLLALQSKVRQIDMVPHLPGLISQLQYGMYTDLSAEQLVSLACLAATMPENQVTFGSLTSEGLMDGSRPNVEKVQTYLKGFLGE